MNRLPWYITATSKGITHIVLDGPFEKKNYAQRKFSEYREVYEFRAVKTLGEKTEIEPTVEIVYSEKKFAEGDKIDAKDIQYGKSKKTVKRPKFSSAKEFMETIKQADIDEEK